MYMSHIHEDLLTHSTLRTSATNCARIYNSTVSQLPLSSSLPPNWPHRLAMDVDDVWDSFFLHALLVDRHTNKLPCLELPHNAPTQLDRLRDALLARNQRMAGPGQEEWNHACSLCCLIQDHEDGTSSMYVFASKIRVRLSCLLI